MLKKTEKNVNKMDSKLQKFSEKKWNLLNQMNILELTYLIFEIKNSLDRYNSKPAQNRTGLETWKIDQ